MGSPTPTPAPTPAGSAARAVGYRWADLPAEQVTPSIVRRYVTGEHVTVAAVELARGGIVPRHAHDSEQVSVVVSGVLKFKLDDGDTIVGAGEVFQIPGGLPHEVEVLETAFVIDVFSPIRQDWLDGTDTYFQRA